MGPRPSQRSDSKRVLKQKRTRTDNFYEGVHRRGVTQLCAHSGLRCVLGWETEAQPAFFFKATTVRGGSSCSNAATLGLTFFPQGVRRVGVIVLGLTVFVKM